VWTSSHNACASSGIRCLRDQLAARIPVRCIRPISTRSGLTCLDCRLNIDYYLVMAQPRRFAKNWIIIPLPRVIEDHPMNFDQRKDEPQIRSEELPVVPEPSEDHGNLSPDGESEETPFSKWILPLSLFVVTIFTTLWAGAYQVYNGPIRGPVNLLLEHPGVLWQGIPFAATLLFILVTHECGHYVLSRIHRVPASLPLFIPGPPYFVGTFGAIIRLRGPIMNRRALFDVGVAGPLAGFIVAVVALIIGLNLSDR
jgi:hypothetical protein